MSGAGHWDRWLVNEDSDNALTPEGFDYQAALARVKALRQRLTNALSTYEIRTASPELYQDSTGLTHYRVTARGDLRPFAPTLAWIVLSHFGDLATVKDCRDPQMLAKILCVLEDFGLKYIPYDYTVGKIYDGKCKALTGFSWANRYFSLTTESSSEESSDVDE